MDDRTSDEVVEEEEEDVSSGTPHDASAERGAKE